MFCLSNPVKDAPGQKRRRPLRFWQALWLGLAMCVPVMDAASAAAPVAQIISLKGNVFVVRAGKTLPLKARTPLQSGDVVKTAANATVQLRLRDKSTLTLGPNSEQSLDELDDLAEESSSNEAYDVLRGITGAATKANSKGFETTSKPTATAGKRGWSSDEEDAAKKPLDDRTRRLLTPSGF
jgi:hypothetical protein